MTMRLHFPRRLAPRRLHLRIALLGGALLALIIGAHTAYTVDQQTQIETTALENQAHALANQIAVSAAALLVTRRYSEIEELLVSIVDFPDVRRIQVSDHRGRVLSDVMHAEGSPAHPVFENSRLEWPTDGKTRVEHTAHGIVVWRPIEAGASVGWVRLTYSLARIAEMRQRIAYNGVWTAFLAVSACLALFAWFLHRPMRAIARATAFAGQLDELRGTPFMPERGAIEIEQLGEALNRVSQRLAEQERALESAHGRLSAILRHAIDGIVAIDEHGKIESANPAAERMFGVGPGELVGQAFNVLVPDFLLSEDSHHDNDPPLPANDAVGTEIETSGLRRDGSAFPLAVGLRAMELEGRRLYVGIVRDITQQKRLDRMKENFVESVSHELRTPLTALHGSLALLATEEIEGLYGKAKSLVGLAYKNSGRLVRLVNDILDFEEIEAGRVSFDMRPIELVQLVRDMTVAYQGLAEEYNVKLIFDTAIRSAWSLADPKRLSQALAALFAYSARLSPAGEKIEVALQRTDGRLRISVTNRGPGIPAEMRPYLFHKFVQVDAPNTRYKSGADVGLGLAKTIVEHQGGMIDFTSKPNVATTFFVDLPEVEREGA